MEDMFAKWIYGRMERWTDDGEMCMPTNGYTHRKMKRWIDRCTDREKEEEKHTQYDGQTDKL